MSNELSVFNFNGADVRIVKDESGEPWFVAKDVCAYFGEQNYRRAVKNCDADERVCRKLNTPGGMQDMIIVNESGLYSLLFAMQPEKARGVTDEYIQERQKKIKSFKRWVTHEVLPEIRKTGAYVAAGETESDEEIMARALLAAQRTIERNKARIEEQAREIEELKPKAAFVDNFIVSHGNILIRDYAKHVKQALNLKKFGQKEMFEFLRNNNYLTLSRYPTQYAVNLQVLHVTEGLHSRNDGTTECHHCTKITPKGQNYFYNKLKSLLDEMQGEI